MSRGVVESRQQASAEPRRWGLRLSFGKNRGSGGRRAARLALGQLDTFAAGAVVQKSPEEPRFRLGVL
jgi:hypothetical protein